MWKFLMHRTFSFPLLHCYSAMDVLQMKMQHMSDLFAFCKQDKNCSKLLDLKPITPMHSFSLFWTISTENLMGNHWNWTFELFQWIFGKILHCLWWTYIRLCSFHFFRHHLTSFTFTQLWDSNDYTSWDCVINPTKFLFVLWYKIVKV